MRIRARQTARAELKAAKKKGLAMVDFNVPPYVGTEPTYIQQAIDNRKICGDGPFTKKCSAWIEQRTGTRRCLLTTSGTTALEMAARLCGIEPGDEVILPSYTFSSSATAFVQVGARLVFVDIRPDTMNIDESKIERAITDKTRAILVMHNAGVACEMDTIMGIARTHGLKVVEDAAHAPLATYKGRALGSIGDFGCFSFHETKNYSMGEGGALLINVDDQHVVEQAEIMREKGTDRSKFMRGQVDKYTWVDYGSSYLPSDLLAAYLWAQLERADDINADRLASWHDYYQALEPLAQAGKIDLPHVPRGCEHNAHMFWMKCADIEERTHLISYLRERDVYAVFHYIPLHSAPAGLRFGRFDGLDEHTTRESERLVRLPMYYGLTKQDRAQVIDAVRSFYADERA